MDTDTFDYQRAKKWFNRLRKVMSDMPDDCEILVSAFGCITVMPQGSYAKNAGSDFGMDNLAKDFGELEFYADRVMGENSTI